ncbi:hypothetical protein GJAV_G00139890 [Gymnothorax javanicus]|nr:hypothetical protein GJAV_G00139890 [Gymnothorax javanicus]
MAQEKRFIPDQCWVNINHCLRNCQHWDTGNLSRRTLAFLSLHPRLSFAFSPRGFGKADRKDMELHLLALLLLSLCRHGLTAQNSPDTDTAAPDTTPRASTTDGGSSSEHMEGDECTAQRLSPEAKRAVGAAILKLGLQLLGNLETTPEQPNVIISPLSVSLALSQLALGASNDTEKLLLQSLMADSLPCYHQSLRGLIQHLRNSSVKIATRVYLDQGFLVKPDFIYQSLRMYDSEPAMLAGLEEINQWVKKATDGHMTDFLSALPENLVLMLINAVYFKGEWVARFDPALTAKHRFYIDSKNMVAVDMMVGPKYPLSMMLDGELGAQVARFPFKGNMSLLVVMPMSGKVNVSTIAAKLNTTDLYARLPNERNMLVKLPKFKLEFSQELEEALTCMGLKSLFLSPNLSRITDGPLVVSSVQHKSSMELHEEGAEASAATAVSTTRSHLSFSVNQPFLFALLDDATQTPIFLGVIRNPDPGAETMLNDEPEETGLPENGESDSWDDLPVALRYFLLEEDRATRAKALLGGARMKRMSLLLFFAVLLSLSCAQLSEPEEDGVAEVVELFTTPRAKMAAAASDFGYNLFRQLASSDPPASFLVSPITISAALTQVSMGASSQAEKQLHRVLHYHNLQDSQLHDTLRDLLSSIRSPGKGFSAAARVYLERRMRLKVDYLNEVEKQYGVRPKALMGGTRDLKEINDWVKQQTGTKVDHFLSSNLPRNAGVVPIGAAFFKGQWVTRFSQSGKTQDFQVDGGPATKVPTMQQDRYPVRMGTDTDLGCTIAQVPMQGDLNMVFFLPDDVTKNMSLIEESLTAEFVQDLSNTLHSVQADLTLPVLKLKYSANVLPQLSDMGLSEWLAQTDLEKITGQVAKVSGVHHKAMMETGSEGSQSVDTSPAPDSQTAPLSFNVNRPFIFLVRDEPSGALLLIGKVLNPQDLA